MGILRNTYIINKTELDLSKFNRKIKDLNDTMKENSEKEIAARNRVDISLEEYESMKEEIKRLKEYNQHYGEFVTKLGVKLKRDPKILLEAELLDVEVQRNPERYNSILRVTFEVDRKYEI